MSNHSISWYALYTRSKHEKKINLQLNQQGVSTFFPMTFQTRKWSDRIKKIEVPLFPNYLFVKTSPDKFWHATDLPGAIKFIGIGKKASKIPDKIIEDLQRVHSEEVQVENLRLMRGEKVKVVTGRFAGIEGIFLRKGTKNMLAISVEIMNRVVMIEVKANQIQNIDK